MGFGWLAAGVVVLWISTRSWGGVPPWWVVPLTAVLLLAPSLLSSSAVSGLFALEGITLPVSASQAAVALGGTAVGSLLGEGKRGLALSWLPERATPIELRASFDQGPPVKAALTLEVPERAAMIGFLTPGERFPYANVVELHGGERITICAGGAGHGGPGCSERTFEVTRVANGFSVGPCDFSQPRLQAFVGAHLPAFMVGEVRQNIALLDLYYYAEDRCVPKRVTQGIPFWPHRMSNGAVVEPLRSFLLIDRDRLYLALLDPPKLVQMIGSRAVSSAPVVRTRETKIGAEGEVTIVVLSPKVRVAFDEIFIEHNDHDTPYCRTGYSDDPNAEVLSGANICKRIRVFTPEHRLRVQAFSGALRFQLAKPPWITVDASCEGRPCGLGDVEADYVSGFALEAEASVPALDFPLRVIGGEPIDFRLAVSTRKCEQGASVCLLASGPGTEYSYPVPGVVKLGAEQREQHWLRVVTLTRPWWLAGIVVATIVLMMAIVGWPASNLEATLLAGFAVLVSARALFAYKVAIRFPHDPEGLASALACAALGPLCIAASSRRIDSAFLLRLGVAVVSALAVIAVFDRAAIIAMSSWPTMMVPAALAVLLLVMAALGGVVWRALSWSVAVTLLVAVLAVRAGLAVSGRERFGAVGVIALYWPLVILLAGAAFHAASAGIPAAMRPVLGGRWVAVWAWIAAHAWGLTGLLVCVAVGVQAVGAGDTGAVMVLAPAVFFAYLATWGPPARGWVRPFAIASVLVGLLGAAFFAASIDRSYPVLATTDAQWAPYDDRPGRPDLLCPVESDRLSVLDLDAYAGVTTASNVTVRRDDFLVRGVANRSGTRIGAEVNEFIEVMRRYAAGPRGDWFGSGFLSAEVRRYGRAEVDAQLFDGVPSILLASEGGTAAVLGLALLHLALLVAVVRGHGLRPAAAEPHAARAFMAVAFAAIPAWTTYLMLGGNFGLLPFTGQSTPFLAVLSGADVLLPTVCWCFALHFTCRVGDAAAA